LFVAEETLVGQNLLELWPSLEGWLAKEEKKGHLRFNERVFDLFSYPEERLLYLFDSTAYHQLKKKSQMEQVVFVHIHLDNLEEATQGLEEQRRAVLLSRVTNTISRWAQEHGMVLRRMAADKFFGVMNEEGLRQVIETKFDILDRVRELTRHNKIPITLSIGVGAGSPSLVELGDLAQSSLDLALGRGGDQVSVKRYPDKVTFYGGKTNAVEKRTRVRARVIAHALRDMIKESDTVFIMGHRDPDMDAVGAAVGMLKAAEVNQTEGYILLDEDAIYPAVENLLQEIRRDRDLRERFISIGEASERITPKSLLILVDVHKPSLVLAPQLLEKFERKVIIDHHRRGEEFIEDPLLVYIEPYASSTSELVAELLEYQSEPVKLSPLEATAMLAGIVVDTNNFSLRTGSRTFDAAAFLKRHGADTILIRKLLQEDKEQYLLRSRVVEGAEIYRGNIAIAVADEEKPLGKLLLAQAADTLLSLNNVIASFVVSGGEDGKVKISARSYGDINVQVIMEKMNGGGHLTNAATQLEDITVADAVKWLKEVLDDYLEGGNAS
jgi:c-di-AMP phosphodiesterase-like protein